MTEGQKYHVSEQIKQKARSVGFDLCGIARARALSEVEPALRKWCKSGMNDTMDYLNMEIEKRVDPRIYFPGAKSVIVTGLNYYSENGQKGVEVPLISRYAYGKDYHEVIKAKLELLSEYIQTLDPLAEGKIIVDSAPLLEKRWAIEAGLGWQGRHSIIINRNIGSYFFIGILMLDIDLAYDEPFSDDFCGDCRFCIDLCPTSAINFDHTIDARRCISNLTIENRAPVSEEFVPLLGGRVYACDKCQEVCPWNKFAHQHNHPEFDISTELAEMTKDEWASITKERFKKLFKGTPIGRVKFERFKSNLKAIFKN